MTKRIVSSVPEPGTNFELAHVLFMDVVGYSQMLIDDQREVLRDLNAIVRGTEQFRAAEAQRKLLCLPTGDGMVVAFFTAPDAAARCAIEIAQGLREHPEIRLRMGIHCGPVSAVTDVNQHTNVAGGGINVAQRVMDCGDAGHILLSQRVAEDLAECREWSASVHDLGEAEIKHGAKLRLFNFFGDDFGNPQRPARIAGDVAGQRAKYRRWGLAAGAIALAAIAFAVWHSFHKPLASTRTAGVAERISAIPEKSIAVLPFENLSDDPENAYFADGIQEEILTRLAKIADLKVISRTSTARYKSSPNDLKEVATQLGVAHIIEGSVQRAADRVRVNVQLIKAANDAHLWAETYDRNLNDIFAVESEIARGVADTLQAKISGLEEHALATRPTENTEAHQLYLKGRYFWNKRTADGIGKSISYFNQAIEKDSAFALAYAGLADAYAILPNYSQTPAKEAYPKAKAAAMKALDLDENVAEAHVSLANVRVWSDWGIAAEPEFKRGLELNPNYSTGHQWYSIYLSVTGRLNEAIAEMKKAQELDPFSIIISTELGCPYLYSKQYEKAIEHFEKAIEMDPNFAFAHFALAEGYDRKGRYEEALVEHEKAIALAQRGNAIALTGSDAPRAWSALAGRQQNTYQALGGPDYWKKRLESTKKLYGHGTATAKMVAEIYGILGDKEQALAWLEKSYQEHDGLLVFLRIQPEFDQMRSDPRFDALVQKVFASK